MLNTTLPTLPWLGFVFLADLQPAVFELGQLLTYGLVTNGAVTLAGGAEVMSFQLTENRGVRLTATAISDGTIPISLFGGITTTSPTGAPPVFSQP